MFNSLQIVNVQILCWVSPQAPSINDFGYKNANLKQTGQSIFEDLTDHDPVLRWLGAGTGCLPVQNHTAHFMLHRRY